MTFTWQFHTQRPAVIHSPTKCHRGPMIDVEAVMSRSFQYMAAYETLRARFMAVIVSTDNRAVRTRETVLRVLSSELTAIFARLRSRRDTLAVTICEKRNSISICNDLLAEMPFFMNAAKAFASYGLPPQQIALLDAALESNSPVLRVAGMSAVILLAAYMEMDYSDGQ